MTTEAPPPPSTLPPPAPPHRRKRRWIVLGALAALIGGVALVYFVVLTQRYRVPSESMLPTYDVGDVVSVSRFDKSPEIGDVIVFHPPAAAISGLGGATCGAPGERGAACAEPATGPSSETFIKRVVAEGGQALSIADGEAIVDAEPVDDDWETRPCGGFGGCNFPVEITIPEDHFFVMGDNRGASEDSRFWGPIPADSVVGVVRD